jgi:hypothetical protein
MNPINSNNNFLKAVLLIQATALIVYTLAVAKNDGWSLFPVFIESITTLSWSGQFNLDFSCYLLLSGLWILWRNKFSFWSIIITLGAVIIGIIFFAPYVFYLLVTEKGDIKSVLIGSR